MKRSTAIRHLVELADVASDGLRLITTEIGWPLAELWVTGALLDPVDELEHGPEDRRHSSHRDRGSPRRTLPLTSGIIEHNAMGVMPVPCDIEPSGSVVLIAGVR